MTSTLVCVAVVLLAEWSYRRWIRRPAARRRAIHTGSEPGAPAVPGRDADIDLGAAPAPVVPLPVRDATRPVRRSG